MYDFISSKGIDPEQEFDLIELIGQGNYGRVYKVLHKKDRLNICRKNIKYSNK